jgi:hypothetical protein
MTWSKKSVSQRFDLALACGWAVIDWTSKYLLIALECGIDASALLNQGRRSSAAARNAISWLSWEACVVASDDRRSSLLARRLSKNSAACSLPRPHRG